MDAWAEVYDHLINAPNVIKERAFGEGEKYALPILTPIIFNHFVGL